MKHTKHGLRVWHECVDRPALPCPACEIWTGDPFATVGNNPIGNNPDRAKGETARRPGSVDYLTGLPTSARMFSELQERLAAGKRFAFILAEIDNMKSVNDRLGIEFGDELLRAVGQVFLERFSRHCCRFGGTTFAAFSEGSGRAEGVTEAKEIERAVAELPFAKRAGLSVTISAGVAVVPDDAATLEALFEHADSALYRRKCERRSPPQHI